MTESSKDPWLDIEKEEEKSAKENEKAARIEQNTAEREAELEREKEKLAEKEAETRRNEGTRNTREMAEAAKIRAKEGTRTAKDLGKAAWEKTKYAGRRATSAEGIIDGTKAVGKGAIGGTMAVGRGAIGLGRMAHNAIGSPVSEGGSTNLFFILAIFVTYVYGRLGYSIQTLSMYIVLGFIGWMMHFNYGAPYLSREGLQGLAKSLALSMIAYFWPKILSLISSTGILNDRMMLILAGAFPAYLIYFVFIEPYTPFLQALNKFYMWSLIIILLAYTIIAVSTGNIALPMVNGEHYDSKAAIIEFKDLLLDSMVVVKDVFMKFFDDAKTALFDRIDYATGGALYLGKTDPKADTPLGVYFEDIEATQSEFYDDEDVGVYTTIKASTLNESIRMNINCKAKSDGGDATVNADEILPSYINIGKYGEEEIDCLFRKGTLKAGRYKVMTDLDYSFETSAKQKAYFINEERANALRGTGIDILKQYGILDENPSTYYTQGPVMVGMDFKKMPIKISETDNRPVTLGISLKNYWIGKLFKLKRFAIKMPSSMQIKDSKCINHEFEEKTVGAQNVYTLKNPGSITDFDPYITFRCPIEFKSVSEVLDSGPLSTHFFEVETEYLYSMENFIYVRVRESAKN